MKIITLILFCTMSLLSCITNHRTSTHNLKAMQKGMTKIEAINQATKEPIKEFEIALNSVPSKKYYILVYEITGYGGGDYDSDYFVVFENDRLIYKGYPYDLNRHPNATLNEIGKIAVAEYDKIK